jgi:hypothetical protein
MGFLSEFWKFIKAFGQHWSTWMSGPLAVPFGLASIYLEGRARALCLLLSAVCFVFASFQIWRMQQREIAQLKQRPYDDQVLQFVKSRLKTVGSDERDVLRYLAFFGERGTQQVYREAGVGDAEFGPILTRANATGLIERDERPRPGRAGLDMFWRISPQFADPLKDELFPRAEGLQQRLFQIALPMFTPS